MIRDYLKVDGSSGLYKNPETGTVINTNEEEILLARKRKENRILEEARKESIEAEVSNLKSEITELKELIKELVGR